MNKIIKNNWNHINGDAFEKAQILINDIHPEGFNVERVRFLKDGCFIPQSNVGHIISVNKGRARLNQTNDKNKPLHLKAGVHLYIPPDMKTVVEGETGSEIVHVSSPSASQTIGKSLLVRDEQFLFACALDSQSFRWVLTPQYLSRRIFLYHDKTLLSKSGNPVSWFHTTMFDVTGLPNNEDGEPVFKMSYNSRTEFNVCYDVKGSARVRMAQHPYQKKNQAWGPWFSLDGDSTYHLNEAAGGPEEECIIDKETCKLQYYRNKHEVYIVNGYVSLFCLFDPGTAGSERHQPGEYSDYEPLSNVIGTSTYEIQQQEIKKYDDMVYSLSLAKARGELSGFYGTPLWKTYLQGREQQLSIERELKMSLIREGNGREQVLSQWMQQ